MLNTLRSTRDILLPSPTVLHDRSKVATDLVVVNGEYVELPRFANDIVSRAVSVEELSFKDGRYAGDKHTFDTLTNGGIDRGVAVYVPDESIERGYPFSMVMDTAWFTGLEGHNDRIAEILMKSLGVRVVLVGPEFSAFDPRNIGAEMNLGRLATHASGFSLFQSAEASAAIYSHLKETEPHLGLEENVYDVGESRGAMIAQIRRIYLECFGSKPITSDLTDPNMAERAFMRFGESVKLLKWPVREFIGAAAVGIDNARRGELLHMRKTVPVEYRQMVGFIGTGPAIFSGEEGLAAGYTEFDHPQKIVNFKGSGAAHIKARRENYKNHHNTDFTELRGCHLSLGYPSVLSYVIARALAHGETILEVGNDVPEELIKIIHKTKPSQGVRKKVVLENAA